MHIIIDIPEEVYKASQIIDVTYMETANKKVRGKEKVESEE